MWEIHVVSDPTGLVFRFFSPWSIRWGKKLASSTTGRTALNQQYQELPVMFFASDTSILVPSVATQVNYREPSPPGRCL